MNSKVIREDECLSATTIPTIFESRGRCRHSPDLVTHRIQRLLSYCVVFVDLLKLRGCWWSCCLIFLLCRTIPLSSKFAINGGTWARYMVELFSEKNRRKRGWSGRSSLLLFLVHLRYLMFSIKGKTWSKGKERGFGVRSHRSLDFSTMPKINGVLFFLEWGRKEERGSLDMVVTFSGGGL